MIIKSLVRKPLVAIPRTAKEVLIGAVEITQGLLKQMRVHFVKPGRFGLLLQSGELSRKIVVREGFAGLAKVIALAIERPIPDKPMCACKLLESDFLHGSRVEAIAIGLPGSIIPEKRFDYNEFTASESCI